MIANTVWENKEKQYREINCNNTNKRKLVEQKSKLVDKQREIGVDHRKVIKTENSSAENNARKIEHAD